jgi:hypothetical protein
MTEFGCEVMGQVQPHPLAMLVAALTGRHQAALDWAEEQCGVWGTCVERTADLAFDQTDYYLAKMGPDLRKRLIAFQPPFDPGRLPAVKQQANDWETALADRRTFPEPRPVNIDPGYVTLAKLVLATTKDRSHRLLLGEGIYGEVTLYYSQDAWRAYPWTYPDYRQPEYHEFLVRCRDRLRSV